jgi:hypothetical protein
LNCVLASVAAHVLVGGPRCGVHLVLQADAAAELEELQVSAAVDAAPGAAGGRRFEVICTAELYDDLFREVGV